MRNPVARYDENKGGQHPARSDYSRRRDGRELEQAMEDFYEDLEGECFCEEEAPR